MPAASPCEVLIIIGGGAAGLNAARILAQAGLEVLLIEARDRLGGRVCSFNDPSFQVPVELGAEFIHGKPPATCDLIKHYGLETVELTDDHWEYTAGRLARMKDFSREMKPVVRLMRRRFGSDKADMTLEAFFRWIAEPRAERAWTARSRRRWHEAVAISRSFFEGFDAVDPSDASARALVRELSGIGDVGGSAQLRLQEGYGALIDAMAREAEAAGAHILLGRAARGVRWSESGVEVETDGGALAAARALITLPVGVLQDESAVRFEPELPQKRSAARLLGAGPVIKIILKLREAIWEQERFARAATGGEHERIESLGMWHMPGAAWPTWWTYLPVRAPVVAGWAAGPAARALTGRGAEELLDSALSSLAASLNAGAGEVRALLEAWHVHDWPADECARGAYSYVKVGGEDAGKRLAEPVADRLFFAGEATDTSGQASTVAGALASGERAAQEMLAL